ncbi:MAG: MgtC/SapB family protein, partial [Desulfobacterales bacterium]|nr:MgtC/SapB family protein [Desulfobacterales bacterium]
MFDYTGNINEVLLRLVVAAVLGGLIGLEREFHGRPAGLRTHILVCLGAAVIMDSSLIFQKVFASEGADSVFRIDPGRIAAGVVTGIGFLGAGA